MEEAIDQDPSTKFQKQKKNNLERACKREGGKCGFEVAVLFAFWKPELGIRTGPVDGAQPNNE